MHAFGHPVDMPNLKVVCDRWQLPLIEDAAEALGATYGAKQVEVVGVDRPMALIIPPGVAHAYKNVGAETGVVFNCPNRLYKGPGRKEPVDEIRHEEDPKSRFRLD